jgi:hypothetical protein
LINDASLLTPNWPQLVEGFWLENDNARRKVERTLRAAALPEVAIEIGAGERDNQRPISVTAPEARYRRIAAPRVERDQEIQRLSVVLLLDTDRVTESF